MGWGVGPPHVRLGHRADVGGGLSLSTMFIAVPTGVKILNWLATMGGNRPSTTPMLLPSARGDVHHRRPVRRDPRVAPSDTQQTDTYYIVAHFHYVLFGGAPRACSAASTLVAEDLRLHAEREAGGKTHFSFMLAGFNMTFGPMHILGLQACPADRTYDDGLGQHLEPRLEHRLAILAVSIIAFILNVVLSRHRARQAVARPSTRGTPAASNG